MDRFDADSLQDLLDSLILQRFSGGPLTLLELQGRVRQLWTLLDVVAVRKGTQRPGSLSTTVDRLQRLGWIKSGQPNSEIIYYSVTPLGEQRVQQELARRAAIVSRLRMEGELNQSLGEFLNGRGLPGSN